MTAAKSKTKRPEEQQKIEHKEKPKEKATSSKPEKTKPETTKRNHQCQIPTNHAQESAKRSAKQDRNGKNVG